MAITAPIVNRDKTAERVRSTLESGTSDTKNAAFRWLLIATLGFSLLILAVLLYDVITGGWSVFAERLGSFVANPSRSRPGEAGVFQGLRGTFWIGIFVIFITFPLGIGAAIYIEEYATDTWFTRMIDINIRNLAGVPSVVYGILGFTIFVGVLDGDIRRCRVVLRQDDGRRRFDAGRAVAADRHHHGGRGHPRCSRLAP